VSQKPIHSTFDHNFGKCTPIYKILPLPDFRGNFVHCVIKILRLTLSMFLHCGTALWNLKITIVADFNDILHARPQNSSYKIWGRLNGSDLNLVTTKSGKQCSTAQKRIRDVSKLKQWIWRACNILCSRQSLMKLAPVNGVNACELAFVANLYQETDIFITCFNFRIIYHIGGLQ